MALQSSKFSYLNKRFDKSNFKSEFILACLRTRDVDEVNWPREMKLMNKLCGIFSSEPDFWYHSRPTFFIPSLAWFLKPNGKKFLSKKKREFDLGDTIALKNAEEAYNNLNHHKVGEDFEQPKVKKIKTINEWLKK